MTREKLYSIYSMFYKLLYSSSFMNFGINSKIIYPIKVSLKKNIFIGENVRIGYKTSLNAESLTNEKPVVLKFSDGTCIGNFNHIVCSKKIVFGKNVLTSDRVYISDNLHDYSDISLPIIKQKIIQLNEVYIGDGSWIGENVCIIGSSVGKNSVVGANSVVVSDIPDFSVAVGIPAKVIKKYNFKTNKWEKVKK